MTDTKTLKKAIKIAIKNGWGHGEYYLQSINSGLDVTFNNDKIYSEEVNFHVNAVLFDNDFAKAFWGVELISSEDLFFGDVLLSKGMTVIAWKTHLQQMVLYKSPIDYLRKLL